MFVSTRIIYTGYYKSLTGIFCDICFLDFRTLLIEPLATSSAKQSINQGSFSEPLKYTFSALLELYWNMLYFMEGVIDFCFNEKPNNIKKQNSLFKQNS